MKKDLTKLVSQLKEEGYSPSDITYILSIETEGILMTKSIYEFNRAYDAQEIDGFPCSSLEVLEKFYGKRLKNMRQKTLEEKVIRLQKCLDPNVYYDYVTEEVEYYLLH